MAKTRLRVPAAHRAPLERLAKLPEGTWVELEGSLREAPTTHDIDALTDKISAVLVSTHDEASLLAEVLLALNRVRIAHNWSIDEVADVLHASSEGLKLEESEREALKSRLASLLGVPSIALTSKVADIATEFPALFHTCRILTDIRPVFGDDPTTEIEGGLLMHTLKLDYFANARSESLSIALSQADLELVRKTLERAAAKAENLSQWLIKVGLPKMEFDVE